VTDDDCPKPWRFNIECHWSGAKTTVVRVVGDLRGDGASSLRRTLAGELTGTPELLVLDISDVEQIDADAIDTVHSVAELADEDGIRFCLVVGARGAVPGCMNVAELTMTFEAFSSVTEALQHANGGSSQRLRRSGQIRS
jgi:anti-anti-sigma regulatory factor